ncbi:uncharacterized protein LOC127841095 isoform X3 [Dreissena polymorpha]|uniref:Protein PET100 homolog, mitochondrial n=1 Tax=Dreissena polymorpha TaxID=45954 RepID=A0A9D4ISR5_DREPO|nr:uncharacterized protein LOC127841095 isoform X3 [Dreissena polymorpha]KAH3782733.1 hypothetical protein DPMN_160652 [Dreissena polymorpha]
MMWRWKLEVFRFGLYIYFPVFVWWSYHTDYFQKKFFLPRLKREEPEMYELLSMSGRLDKNIYENVRAARTAQEEKK